MQLFSVLQKHSKWFVKNFLGTPLLNVKYKFKNIVNLQSFIH